MVLRQALEKHYEDLVAFTTQLDAAVKNPRAVPLRETGDRMWRALQQHLPRSPVWKRLDRWQQLWQRRSEVEEQTVHRMEGQIAEARELGSALGAKGVELDHDGLSKVVTDRLKEVAVSDGTPVTPLVVTVEQGSHGLARLMCKATTCAAAPEAEAYHAKAFITQFLSDLDGSPEANEMANILSELKDVAEALSEELITITLRRVLPGRCTYCPI